MLTKVKISARIPKVLDERRAKQNGNEKRTSESKGKGNESERR